MFLQLGTLASLASSCFVVNIQLTAYKQLWVDPFHWNEAELAFEYKSSKGGGGGVGGGNWGRSCLKDREVKDRHTVAIQIRAIRPLSTSGKVGLR